MTANRGPVSAILAAAQLIALTACRSGPDLRYDAVPPGTEVVTNPGRLQAPTEYSLSAEPTYRVGGPAPTPEGELEPTMGELSTVPLSDGGVLVAEETRIHIFDASGVRRALIGRSGSGPGEFLNISSACGTRGDTVVLEDFNNARIAVIDASLGTLVRSFPSNRGHLQRGSCFEDGTFVLEMEVFNKADKSLDLTYNRVRVDGSVVNSMKATHFARGGVHQVGPPSVAATGSLWYFADANFSEIRTYDTTGAIIRITRTDDPLREVSIEESNAARGFDAAKGSTAPAQPEGVKVRLPFFSVIAVSPNGGLWFREPNEPGPAYEIWTGFNPAGKLIGRLRIKQPPLGEKLYTLGFTNDGAIVRRGDANGDAFIEIYKLVAKPAK